jgi:divinyl chlorophyllide a 8-vinyl-reductase
MNSERLAAKRVVMLGATGTIGRATVRALLRHGHAVKCLVRPGTPMSALPEGVVVQECVVTDPLSIRAALGSDRFDAVVSCMASRTGAPKDAWAIDHQAHLHLLDSAKGHGATQFVLLSAICVQKPKLEFQRAKLAFERELMNSGLTWSIVRPTAFFKSISGQVQRVQQGKPFLLFGDGALTACKPISDDDCAEFLAGCLREPDRWNRILPIGGPGMAMTLKEQGELLFKLAGKPPKFTRVPVAMFDVIIGALSTLGLIIPPLKNKAEFARIGRYYATESMLVWDERTQRYDAAATPSFGKDTLAEHYRKLLRGELTDDRGDHAVF